MADDIKSLTKKCTDLEKRLKTAEDKIKILVDSLTKSKDIEKVVEVLDKAAYKKAAEDRNTFKENARIIALQEKATEALEREMRKESDRYRKEYEKMAKSHAKEADMQALKSRLAVVEAQVRAALSR